MREYVAFNRYSVLLKIDANTEVNGVIVIKTQSIVFRITATNPFNLDTHVISTKEVVLISHQIN